MVKNIRTTSDQNDCSSKSMNIFDGRYYSLNKRMLCAVGLWPYQPLPERVRGVSVMLFLSFTVGVPQIRAMIKAWGRFNKFVECFSPLVANLACDVKLINCMYHVRQIRELLDVMQKDWDSVRLLPQVYILKKCGEKGRRFTIMYLTIVYVTVSAWITMPLVPKIMDAMIPLNHSRARFDIFPTDYMVDPDEYFYPILIHCACVTIMALLTIVAVDTFYMSLSQHVCAMFEILRYHLENILQEDPADAVLRPNYHEDVYYHEIVSCIKKHKLLVQYIKNMESTCKWCLFIIVGFNMLGLSFTGYQDKWTSQGYRANIACWEVHLTRIIAVVLISGSLEPPPSLLARTVAKDTPTQDVFKFGMFTISQVIHLFCNSLPGHWIMDSSSYFPDATYSCRWYMMSLRSRKLLVILLRASIEPCKITAGKIYVMSIENFCSVLQTSMSYLTVLNTVQ